MQTYTSTPLAKKGRVAAYGAYMQGVSALLAAGKLSAAEHEFLLALPVHEVDEAGRIVLYLPSAADASRPVLNRLAIHLRETGISAGLGRSLTAPQQAGKRPSPHRVGRPKQKVLYLPGFLASVTLPHSRVAGSEFSRVNGDIRLSLLAPETPGLPYGVYPRLILIHLTTKALLQRERTFYVGESANAFLALMGIKDSGGATGASTRARDQLRRLCLTSFAYHDKSQDRGRNIVLADKWVTWPGRGVQVTLGERFYSLARSGSVPLDTAILDGLRRSPLALDAYVWLTYRVARLNRETVIPWRSLEIQFGAEYTRPRNFRLKFRRSLEAIKELWNGIEAEPQEKGLLIRPCAPSVLSWLERCAPKP